jgi:maltose 6'-phosphate phosphatase
MHPVQLLYVENIISRRKRKPRQKLTFHIQLENISLDKQVDVYWSGEDGHWHTLAASYLKPLPDNSECWQAQVSFHLSTSQALPGNIRFSLCYRSNGQEFWDNNHGQNYESQADSGIRLGPTHPIQSIPQQQYLPDLQKFVPVIIALDKSVSADKVTLHWTTDNWQHSYKTVCQHKPNYWDIAEKSNARNPNQYGTRIWHSKLRIGNAFSLEYSICCEGHGQTLWANNHGQNYRITRKPLSVMILNLHCYQEADQDRKFSYIARAIKNEQVDIVCFQEVAENWNDGQGDWPSNSANIINQRLPQPFHLYTDWSHLGFDRYREGVAILSKFPILKQEARYVSDSHDAYSIHSRKVVMAQINAPHLGLLNVFSAHLSWWEDGFAGQFQRLCQWASENSEPTIKGTLLCGDFNIAAGAEGYHLVVDGHEYEDQYLAANQQGLFDQIFRVNDRHWGNLLTDDYRIDYIFKHRDSQLRVTSARVIFTEHDYGQVSDHCGYLMTFEPNE